MRPLKVFKTAARELSIRGGVPTTANAMALFRALIFRNHLCTIAHLGQPLRQLYKENLLTTDGKAVDHLQRLIRLIGIGNRRFDTCRHQHERRALQDFGFQDPLVHVLNCISNAAQPIRDRVRGKSWLGRKERLQVGRDFAIAPNPCHAQRGPVH